MGENTTDNTADSTQDGLSCAHPDTLPVQGEPERGGRYLPRDQRQAQILAVGLRLFSALPYEEVSIDRIAEEAGISKGLLYHYFRNKKELFAAVIQEAAGQLLEAILPDPARSGVENARAGLRAYLEFVAQHADAWLALMSGGADGAVSETLERTRAAIVAQLLEAARIAPESVAHRVAARAWLGAVEAASLDWLRHRGRPGEQLSSDRLVDMLSASLFTHLLVAHRQEPGAVRGSPLDGLALLSGLLSG